MGLLDYTPITAPAFKPQPVKAGDFSHTENIQTPTPQKPVPETLKMMLVKKYPDGTASDGTRYADMDPVELAKRVVTKYPDGVTSAGVPYKSYLPPEAPPAPPTTKNVFGGDTSKDFIGGALGTIGGVFKGAVNGVLDAAKAGGQQMLQGIQQGARANNPLQVLKGGLDVASGASSIVSAPFTPAINAVVSPAVNAISDKISNNKAVQNFALSPAGERTSQGAQVVADLANVAGTVGGFQAAKLTPGEIARSPIAQAVKPVISGVKQGLGKVDARLGMQQPPAPRPLATSKLVTQRVGELSKLEANNAPLRKVIAKSSKQGIDVKQTLAETDLLHGAVDDNGTIRTQPAIQELNDFIQPYESVISKSLDKEGVKISLKSVEKQLAHAIDNSGLEADALETAYNKLGSTMKGLERRADADGNISISKVHDAKVSKYANIDYINPGAKVADKAIARTFKEIVEQNTKSADVKTLNAELSKHFAVLNLLEKLDGKKVEGGRLGKYFAKTVGAVVGSHFGPLGSIVGAELGGRIKGSTMSRSFGGKTGAPLTMSETMKSAHANVQSSNSLGSRNITQSKTTAPIKNGIPDSVPQKGILGKAKDVFNTIKKEGNRGFVKIPGGGKKAPALSTPKSSPSTKPIMTQAAHQHALRVNVSAQLAKFDTSSDLTAAMRNSKDFMRIEELRTKDQAGKSLTPAELREAVALLRDHGVETAPGVQPRHPETQRYMNKPK